ncbi:MAG: hypothetical protein HQ592_08325 [Planctomycetes bacterium]|nr:hypothetical protein [Planctomycetota bacterium]
MTASSVLNYVRGTVKYFVLIAVALTLVYMGRSFSCMRVDGTFIAMQPSIHAGAILVVDHRPARTVMLDPGDTICFTHTSSKGVSTAAGRIAALEGDSFRYGGQAPVVSAMGEDTILVPRGHVLLTYENPSARKLGLSWHLVPVTAIKGKVMN